MHMRCDLLPDPQPGRLVDVAEAIGVEALVVHRLGSLGCPAMEALPPRGGHSLGRPVRLALWAGGLIAIAAFLLWATRGQTFYADEWAFFVRSPGLDAGRLLEPHQGNLVLSTVLLYK